MRCLVVLDRILFLIAKSRIFAPRKGTRDDSRRRSTRAPLTLTREGCLTLNDIKDMKLTIYVLVALEIDLVVPRVSVRGEIRVAKA